MKSVINFTPGASAECKGKRYVITHVLDVDTVLCEEEVTGKKERLFIKDIVPVSVGDNGKGGDAKSATTDLTVPSDEDWQEAGRRLDIIKPLLGTRRTMDGINEQARAAGVHPATLYRWIDAYERTEKLTALLPTKSKGGRGKSRLLPVVEVVLQATVEDFYLNKQKRSAQKICEEVMRRCRNAGLTPPHPNTVRNRINQLSEEVKLKRRAGARAAKEKFAPIAGHFPGADYPLAVVQIDHTPLDIVVVDEEQRLPVGRPWITLAIDVFSRMVTGFYISLDPPGALSTGLCIAHSILMKDEWLARLDITTSWPCWGVMKKIHLDNAKEFRGTMLKRACEEYGIELDFRPVATPHYGGHIERMLGTILKEIHDLPGTTFSNPRERGEYDSEGKAVLTLRELEKWVATFIVEVYHQRMHSALKLSPVKKYEQGIVGSKAVPGIGLPARIADEDRLRLDFMPYEERTVQQYGVVIDEIHYYHDVLRRFIDAREPDELRRKRKFIFKRDPRDISEIYFYDPELNRYSTIPYRDTSHPAISLWELREVRDRLEKEGRENIDESLIFEGYERMRAQEEKAVHETKRVRRGKQRRRANLQIVKPNATSIEATPDPDDSRVDQDIPDIAPFDEIEEWD